MGPAVENVFATPVALANGSSGSCSVRGGLGLARGDPGGAAQAQTSRSGADEAATDRSGLDAVPIVFWLALSACPPFRDRPASEWRPYWRIGIRRGKATTPAGNRNRREKDDRLEKNSELRRDTADLSSPTRASAGVASEASLSVRDR